MKAAISALYVALDVVETNAPINEAEGNIEMAQKERESAEDFRKALELLEGACHA